VCERERERERENRDTEKGSWWENFDLLRGRAKPTILFLKLWGLSYTNRINCGRLCSSGGLGASGRKLNFI
jgi:hypothetical protein